MANASKNARADETVTLETNQECAKLIRASLSYVGLCLQTLHQKELKSIHNASHPECMVNYKTLDITHDMHELEKIHFERILV